VCACISGEGFVPDLPPEGLAPAAPDTAGDRRDNISNLDGPPLLIGQSTTLTLTGVPAGAELVLLASQTGFGQGPCDTFFTGTCTTLLEPWAVSHATATQIGQATFEVDVAPDEPARPVYLEALIRDVSNGSTTRTNAIERHFTVPADQAAVSFREVTDAVGLTETYTHSNTHTGGAAFVDYNGDFWPDLFITNGGGEPHYLYRNQGDGTFVDVSHLVPKPDLEIEDAGVKFADLDNDGDSEIIVVVDNPAVMHAGGTNVRWGGPNLLYDNQGDGTFVERALPSGLVDPQGRRNSCGALADYDLDGYVDAYLGVWAMGSGPYIHDNRLLHNNGDGTFSEVEGSATHGRGLDTLVVQFFDPDLDGRPDLYVANVASNVAQAHHDDYIYRGAGSDFIDATADSPGVGDDARAAMGMDVGDIDNDGDFEVYLTDGWGDGTDPTGGVLYAGNPDGSLTDNLCDVAGVCTGYHTWPVHFADFDRDGWVDLRIGTTYAKRPDLMYINNGDGTFASHEVLAFTGNLSQGSAVADYDGDGDVDLFAQNRFMDSLLFENEGLDANHWVALKLIGTVSNRDAIGALVRLEAGGITQLRRVSGTDSAHSQSELIVHFGVGQQTEARVEIQWPGGAWQTLEGIPVNALTFVDETSGILEEQLLDATLHVDEANQTLRIDARSGFGGRTALSLDGFGDLTYDAETVQFSAVFHGVAADPGAVTLRSVRGGTWVLGADPSHPGADPTEAKAGRACGCHTFPRGRPVGWGLLALVAWRSRRRSRPDI